MHSLIKSRIPSLLSSLRKSTNFARTVTNYADKWECREIRIPTPAGSLAAKDWGDVTATPILALHGWQDNANSFDKLIPLLEPKYRIIALDFMGHGHSAHLTPGSFYTANQFIMDIQRVADFFNWEQFRIIGHSMGGGMGHVYAMLFPERLKTLVTIDVPLPGTMPPDRYVMMTVFAALNLLRVERESFEGIPHPYPESEIIAKHMAAIKNAYTEDAVRILMKRGCTKVGDNLYQFNRDRRLKFMFWNSFDADTNEALSARYKNELLALRCLPMQFKHEGYFKTQEIHKQNCSRYKYEEVEGLHHIHMTDPTKICTQINDFLRESKDD